MVVPITFIFSALCLYTFSIFKERKTGHLNAFLMIIFASGFTCDLIGTSMMFSLAKVKFSLALHSICGYSALLIMLAHLIWAILAICGVGNCQRNFTRFSIYAWAIWIVAFISGIPKVSSLILSWLL